MKEFADYNVQIFISGGSDRYLLQTWGKIESFLLLSSPWICYCWQVDLKSEQLENGYMDQPLSVAESTTYFVFISMIE